MDYPTPSFEHYMRAIIAINRAGCFLLTLAAAFIALEFCGAWASILTFAACMLVSWLAFRWVGEHAIRQAIMLDRMGETIRLAQTHRDLFLGTKMSERN